MDRYGRNREEIEDIEDRRILKFFLIVRYGGYRGYLFFSMEKNPKKISCFKNSFNLSV